MGQNESAAAIHNVFDSAAKSYDQSGVAFFEPIGQRLADFADIGSGDSVLDVGCGRGAVLFPAAEYAEEGGEVIGIDLSEEMIRYASENSRESGGGRVSVQVMNGQTPSFPAHRFDVVTGSFSIFIWTYGSADLRPYRELLRQGGRFAMSAPSFFPSPSGKWRFLPEEVHDLLLPHLLQPVGEADYNSPYADLRDNWLVSPETAKAALREAGFTEPEVHEENLPVVVESGAQWVQWTYATGLRLMWDRLGEQRSRTLGAEVARRLDALRGVDGSITLPTPIVYLRARTSPA